MRFMTSEHFSDVTNVVAKRSLFLGYITGIVTANAHYYHVLQMSLIFFLGFHLVCLFYILYKIGKPII